MSDTEFDDLESELAAEAVGPIPGVSPLFPAHGGGTHHPGASLRQVDPAPTTDAELIAALLKKISNKSARAEHTSGGAGPSPAAGNKSAPIDPLGGAGSGGASGSGTPR